MPWETHDFTEAAPHGQTGGTVARDTCPKRIGPGRALRHFVTPRARAPAAALDRMKQVS